MVIVVPGPTPAGTDRLYNVAGNPPQSASPAISTDAFLEEFDEDELTLP